MPYLDRLKNWARRVKRDVVAVYFAARDRRTPVVTRVVAMAVAAYALSPVDLIPDFVSVLGYLDDLLIVPFGMFVVIRMLPIEVLLDARAKASALLAKPTSHVAAVLMVVVWLGCAAGVAYWWYRP
jgi:uncharacterized membrane protein YkvA (DUF1232 family)